MINDFFDHLCCIYHLQSTATSPGYALPASPAHSYPAKADIEDVHCHFGVKAATVTVTQSEPANMLDAKIKLTLPVGTDIRLNDKIVWNDTGLVFTAELPRNIRGHHKFVYVKRLDEQRPL